MDKICKNCKHSTIATDIFGNRIKLTNIFGKKVIKCTLHDRECDDFGTCDRWHNEGFYFTIEQEWD